MLKNVTTILNLTYIILLHFVTNLYIICMICLSFCFYNNVYYMCNKKEFDMSFNFQGPGDMPIIRGAESMMNNGGGGNLGYFQGRKKKKEDEAKNLFNTEEEDSFTLSAGKLDENAQNDLPKEDSISDKLKGFLKKLTNNSQNESN